MSHVQRLAVAALLLATVAAGCSAQGEEIVTITIRHSAFEPAAISVPRGVPITFVLVNEDPIDHEWLIGDDSFHDGHRTGTHGTHGAVPNEVSIPALETVTTTMTFDQSGKLAYICHLPAHEAYGMVGWITVKG